MLYDEFLQLAAFIQIGSILISDDRMSKWQKLKQMGNIEVSSYGNIGREAYGKVGR